MKNFIISALLLASVSGCTRDQEATPEADALITTANYRQKTTVKGTDTELDLKVAEVRESRCPMDVVCVWAGMVEVDFIISDGKNQTDVSANLRSDKNQSNIVKFSLSDKNYLLHLKEVLPYPKSNEKPDLNDYKVGVSIQNN